MENDRAILEKFTTCLDELYLWASETRCLLQAQEVPQGKEEVEGGGGAEEPKDRYKVCMYVCSTLPTSNKSWLRGGGDLTYCFFKTP